MLNVEERDVRDLRYPDMTHPQLPRQVMQARQGFVNATPPAGFGRAIYADSVSGAMGRGFGNGSPIAQALGPDGKPSFRPFGRSAETQQRINDRVAQYQSAIDLMHSMRGVPTERQRLRGRAEQRVSLNQGLGGFVNQAADRNYAREQLKALDAREASALESANERDRLAFDRQQKGIENVLEAEKVSQGRYKVQDAKYDPFGNQIQPASVFDTSTAQFLNQGGGFQAPMSIEQATDQATREASERAGWFSSDKSDFGMSRAQWIEQRIRELTGQIAAQPQAAGSGMVMARNPKTGEVVFWDGSAWLPAK